METAGDEEITNVEVTVSSNGEASGKPKVLPELRYTRVMYFSLFVELSTR